MNNSDSIEKLPFKLKKSIRDYLVICTVFVLINVYRKDEKLWEKDLSFQAAKKTAKEGELGSNFFDILTSSIFTIQNLKNALNTIIKNFDSDFGEYEKYFVDANDKKMQKELSQNLLNELNKL